MRNRKSPSENPTTQNRAVPPAIKHDVVYPIERVRACWFPSKAAWLAARKRGLGNYIYYVGRKGFINGSDLQKGLQEQGTKRP